MEEITGFIARIAAILAFCGATALSLLEIRIIGALVASEPSAGVFRIIF